MGQKKQQQQKTESVWDDFVKHGSTLGGDGQAQTDDCDESWNRMNEERRGKHRKRTREARPADVWKKRKRETEQVSEMKYDDRFLATEVTTRAQSTHRGRSNNKKRDIGWLCVVCVLPELFFPKKGKITKEMIE